MTRTTSAALQSIPEAFFQHHWSPLEGTLKEWGLRKRVPQVLLITGPSGVGKNTVAHLLARWVFCERGAFAEAEPTLGFAPAEQDFTLRSCGECGPCKKAIANAHVDLVEIAPDPEDTTPSLKIEAFRDLQRTMGFRPNESPYRIVLIRECDRMTPQAANAMLKTLEEPPSHVLFFLTASEPELVLPTLRSRCQVLRLKPFSETQVLELLSQAPASDRRALAAKLCQGSWGRAWTLLDSGAWEAREKLLLFLRKPGQSYSDLVEWASKDSQSAALLLDLLEYFIADLMHHQALSATPTPASAWQNSDAALTLSQHAERVRTQLGGAGAAIEFWSTRAARVSQARREIHTPMNRKLLIQDVLAPWISVIA